jgi:hypothetical protein
VPFGFNTTVVFPDNLKPPLEEAERRLRAWLGIVRESTPRVNPELNCGTSWGELVDWVELILYPSL